MQAWQGPKIESICGKGKKSGVGKWDMENGKGEDDDGIWGFRNIFRNLSVLIMPISTIFVCDLQLL